MGCETFIMTKNLLYINYILSYFKNLQVHIVSCTYPYGFNILKSISILRTSQYIRIRIYIFTNTVHSLHLMLYIRDKKTKQTTKKNQNRLALEMNIMKISKYF